MALDQQSVLEALKVVIDPDLHRDIVSLGFVKNVKISGGDVSFTIELTTPACPVKDQMRDQSRAAVQRLPGVTRVDVEMTASVRSAVSPDAGRQGVPGVKNVIAVGAGKGGVGKTTVSVNLALALARAGSTGRTDRRRHLRSECPDDARHQDAADDRRQEDHPAEKYGLQVISMGFLTEDDAPIIWRGPMLHGALQQFFREVRVEGSRLPRDRSAARHRRRRAQPEPDGSRRRLDRGDDPAGSVVGRHEAGGRDVPQAEHPADWRGREHELLRVSQLLARSDIFGRGGGEQMAIDRGIPFVGRIPIYQPIREGGDRGVPIVISEPDSPAARAFMAAAEQTAAQVSIASYKATTIPLTVVR